MAKRTEPTPADRTDTIQRTVLPIPDRPYLGVRPLEARDPAAKFPPIQPLRPPHDAPNVLVVLLDDVGFGASSTFGGPCHTPTLERLAQNGLKYNRFHTTALCSADPLGAADRPQSPHRRLRRDFGNRNERPGLYRHHSQPLCTAGENAEVQRLFDRAVREVPRSARVRDQQRGAVRPVAHRAGVRALLRLRRRRDASVLSRPL